MHDDSAGSVLGIIGEGGRLVEGYVYRPYGAPTILVPANGATGVKWDGTDAVSTGTYGTDPMPRPYSPSGNLWFFTGRQYDPEVGLYSYRARQYLPGLGQFMSLDPLGAWGDAVSLGNPYAYVGNNPGSWTDPSGMVWWNPRDRDFAVWEGAGSTVSIAAGTLGATAGGAQTVLTGQGLWGFQRGWDAGESFSPLGSIGDASRERIRENLATSAAPAYALAINDFVGPAQTRTDAAIGAAFTAIPVGGVGGKGLSKADDTAKYAGKTSHSRTGTTVLGSHDSYVSKGEELGARYFFVPDHHWVKLAEDERWAANAKFLDRTVARGDDVVLANLPPAGRMSYLAREIPDHLKRGHALKNPSGWCSGGDLFTCRECFQ